MDNRPDALYRALTTDLAPYLSDKSPVEISGYGPPMYVKRFAAAYMMDNLLKKRVTTSTAADRNALKTFLASNKKCERWIDARRVADRRIDDELLLNQFQVEIDNLFLSDYGADDELSWSNILQNARSGPGSSVMARGTSHYAKHFSSPLSATSTSLYNVYKAYAYLLPEFSVGESIRQEDFGSVRIVEGSQTSFAPKNANTSRLICTEPTLNMYLQLGIGTLIERRLHRHFGIDLSVQPDINRYLAKLGSVNVDPVAKLDHVDTARLEQWATIDLSSASDSISLKMIGSYMPPEWTSVLLETRSRTTQVLIDGKRKSEELYMVSTMGNGFTFQLQTAIFACVVSACLRYQDIRPVASLPYPTFSVFGDDIIVPKKIYARVCRLLALLGFAVNADKSFESGAFKESCGHDYYHGYNVRPVFVRELKSATDHLVILNLLNEWTARTGIPCPIAIGYLLDQLKRFYRDDYLFVPLAENVDAGIRVPFALLMKPRRDSNGSFVYKRRIAHVAPIRIGEGTIRVPKGQKKLVYNPAGLMRAFLLGEIRNGKILSRSAFKVLPYDVKRAVTPNWDYLPPLPIRGPSDLRVESAQLATATILNFSLISCYLDKSFLA